MFSCAPTWADEFEALFRPAFLYISALKYFTLVIFETVILKLRPFALIDLSTLRDEAFSRFWINCTADIDDPPGGPQGSAALIPPLLATASGVVLDLGPGTGSQMPLFGRAPAITAVYGAEPCVGLHAQLRARVADAGMAHNYHVVPAGAEVASLVPALAKQGLLGQGGASAGVFDTIVSIRVLCSVPAPEETIAGLYALLKPGGRWLVVEHVVNPWWRAEGSVVARLLQLLYTLLGWSFLVGDCHVQRDTRRMLEDVAKADGGWDPAGGGLRLHFGFSSLPYVAGALVKRRK